MIHRVCEGKKLHFGINYFINWDWFNPWARNEENTCFRFILIMPLFAFYSTYTEPDTLCVVRGWRVYIVGFRYRWRDPIKFDSAHLCDIIRGLMCLSRKLVKTREEIEDSPEVYC